MTEAELHRKVKLLEDKVKSLEAQLEDETRKRQKDIAALSRAINALDARTLGSMRIGK